MLAPAADDPGLGDRDDFLYRADAGRFVVSDRRAHPPLQPSRRRSSRTPRPSRSACRKPIACSVERGSSDRPLLDPAVLAACRVTAAPLARCSSSADDGRRARHPFLLRQRQHSQPVRVRAADLVQQPALRRPQRQQGSDRRRQRPDRRAVEPHDDSACAAGHANGCAAEVRDRSGPAPICSCRA